MARKSKVPAARTTPSKTKRVVLSEMTASELLAELEPKHPGLSKRLESRVAELQLGRKLRDLRVKRGLSQAELAGRAGTAQASVARIESGRALPKLDLIVRLAPALGARVDLKLVTERA